MTPSPFQRPALELAEVIRRHGHRLGEQLSGEHRRILRAIASCRTAALGGHVETCDQCQYQRIAYNSCRNRHCPRCQGSACAQWMEDRADELLPVEYFHVVFTLPDTFNALALGNKRTLYGVLFDAVSQTLGAVAANPKHLGARIGFIAILHTWGQNLSLHPHVHCVIPGGAISNRRLVSIDDQTVTFGWKDYAHGNRPRTTTLDGGEFLRRFLLHAVPSGFMRIRHFGLFANRTRTRNLETCRRLLSAPSPVDAEPATAPLAPVSLTGVTGRACCPLCGCGRMIPGSNLSPPQLIRLTIRLDSS